MTENIRINSAEESPEKEQTIGKENTDKIEQALDWATAQSEDRKTCPFCGWLPAYETKHKDVKLRDHLRQRHMFHSIEAFVRGSVDGPSVPGADGNVMEEVGLEVVDSFDESMLLSVPNAIKARMEAKGSKLYWASPDRVQQHVDRGMEIVKANPGEVSWGNNSTEDSTVRCNEMILMEIPERLRPVLAARKARKTDQSLMTRKEQFERQIDGHARDVYDLAVRKGKSKQQALNLARAAERGLALGTVDIRRG